MPRSFDRPLVVLLSLLLSLGGGTLCAQTPYGAPSATTRLRAWDADSILALGIVRMDEQEVAYARAALPTLIDTSVQVFARGVIADYSTNEIMFAPVAGRYHVPIYGTPTASLVGVAVSDSQYLARTILRHQRLLASLPVTGTPDEELRQQILSARETVQKHLDEAMRLQARVIGRQ